ncbi:MAG: helix-turn-helix transcriptional regulator [Blastocatellia bacterium]
MSLTIKILSLLNLLGAGQGLFLSGALLAMRRRDRTANRLLAAFVASTALQISGAVLFTTRYILDVPHLSRLHHPLIYLSSPLLYLYLRALVTPERSFRRMDVPHFLPAALCALYLIPFYLQDAAAKIASAGSTEYERWYYLRHTLAVFQAIIYLYFIVRLTAEYKRRAERTPLIQTMALVGLMLLVFFGGLARLLLRDRSMETNLLLPLCSSIMVYALAWLTLTRPEAMAETGHSVTTTIPPPSPVAAQEAPEPASGRKYERSTLTPDRSAQLLARLQERMEAEKPYLDGQLTLQKLAARLSVSPQHLSQAINEQTGQSFSDYINALRIDEARRLLTDPARKHHSILAIALDVGFNSKSTFNAAFKKHTGVTPSEFRDASTIVETA